MGDAMLGSVMPGVRELRAPLAAGYLWLLAIWLALEPSLDHADLDQGLYASIVELKNAISALGTGVALSVLAYIVGSLSEQVLGPVTRTRRPARWLAERRARGATPGHSGVTREAVGRLRTRAPTLVGSVLPRLGVKQYERDDRLDNLVLAAQGFDEPDIGLGRRGADALEALSAPFTPRIERELHGCSKGQPNRLVPFLERVRKASEVPNVPVEVAVQAALRRAILDEARLIRLRMLYDEKDLYSEIDRFSAESEFRFAILPGATVLTGVLLFRGATWWLVLLLAVALVLVYAQGVSRRIHAGDILLEAVQLKPERSPFLEYLQGALPEASPAPASGVGTVRRADASSAIAAAAGHAGPCA